MNPPYFSLLPFIISSSILVTLQATSNIDKFLQCLPNHSDSTNPILNTIYTPQNSSFLSVLQSYIRNERFNQPNISRPLLIVTPLGESHVQGTIICAKANDLHVRIRSGGHDYEGLSYVSSEPFILLDLFNLRAIDIDISNEVAWAQAGATLGELYYKIANLSTTHAFPGGVCYTIGLGGHISGGGYGNLMRKYGLSSDNVVDAKVIDANGNILDRKSMGEDLFWAIRGGGAASFGVVLAWKLNLVRVPKTVTVFKVRRTLEQGATNIVHKWQTVAPNLDPNLFIRAQLRVVNEAKQGKIKAIEVFFIALYLGKPQELVTLLNKSFPSLDLNPTECIEMPWVNSALFWYNNPVNTPTEELLNRVSKHRVFFKYRSDYVKEPIPKSALEQVWKKMLELNISSIQFSPYGGKMSRIPENATPFPHRAGILFKIQYTTVWFDSKDSENMLNASKVVYDVLGPYVSKNPREHFFNYRDLDIGTNENGNVTFGRGYFKGNWERLLQVKARVDPNDFFRYEQSVPLIRFL